MVQPSHWANQTARCNAKLTNLLNIPTKVEHSTNKPTVNFAVLSAWFVIKQSGDHLWVCTGQSHWYTGYHRDMAVSSWPGLSGEWSLPRKLVSLACLVPTGHHEEVWHSLPWVADDMQAYLCYDSKNQGRMSAALLWLEASLIVLSQWMLENKLRFNTNKTDFIHSSLCCPIRSYWPRSCNMFRTVKGVLLIQSHASTASVCSLIPTCPCHISWKPCRSLAVCSGRSGPLAVFVIIQMVQPAPG